jgi:hypothetical protein
METFMLGIYLALMLLVMCLPGSSGCWDETFILLQQAMITKAM